MKRKITKIYNFSETLNKNHDKNMGVLVMGELGSGKSTLIKSFLKYSDIEPPKELASKATGKSLTSETFGYEFGLKGESDEVNVCFYDTRGFSKKDFQETQIMVNETAKRVLCLQYPVHVAMYVINLSKRRIEQSVFEVLESCIDFSKQFVFLVGTHIDVCFKKKYKGETVAKKFLRNLVEKEKKGFYDSLKKYKKEKYKKDKKNSRIVKEKITVMFFSAVDIVDNKIPIGKCPYSSKRDKDHLVRTEIYKKEQIPGKKEEKVEEDSQKEEGESDDDDSSESSSEEEDGEDEEEIEVLFCEECNKRLSKCKFCSELHEKVNYSTEDLEWSCEECKRVWDAKVVASSSDYIRSFCNEIIKRKPEFNKNMMKAECGHIVKKLKKELQKLRAYIEKRVEELQNREFQGFTEKEEYNEIVKHGVVGGVVGGILLGGLAGVVIGGMLGSGLGVESARSQKSKSEKLNFEKRVGGGDVFLDEIILEIEGGVGRIQSYLENLRKLVEYKIPFKSKEKVKEEKYAINFTRIFQSLKNGLNVKRRKFQELLTRLQKNFDLNSKSVKSKKSKRIKSKAEKLEEYEILMVQIREASQRIIFWIIEKFKILVFILDDKVKAYEEWVSEGKSEKQGGEAPNGLEEYEELKPDVCKETEKGYVETGIPFYLCCGDKKYLAVSDQKLIKERCELIVSSVKKKKLKLVVVPGRINRLSPVLDTSLVVGVENGKNGKLSNRSKIRLLKDSECCPYQILTQETMDILNPKKNQFSDTYYIPKFSHHSVEDDWVDIEIKELSGVMKGGIHIVFKEFDKGRSMDQFKGSNFLEHQGLKVKLGKYSESKKGGKKKKLGSKTWYVEYTDVNV